MKNYKYTIFEQKYIDTNVQMYVRVYAKTGDKKAGFEDCKDYRPVAYANTVKEAEATIENLGGNFERI